MVWGWCPNFYFVKYSLWNSVKQHAHIQHCITECCNNTHEGAPCTSNQTIHTRIDRTAVLASTVPSRKLKELAKMWCACNTSPKLALWSSVTAITLLVVYWAIADRKVLPFTHTHPISSFDQIGSSATAEEFFISFHYSYYFIYSRRF